MPPSITTRIGVAQETMIIGSLAKAHHGLRHCGLVSTYIDFNCVVAVDVIWLETGDSDGASIPAVNVVDLASTLAGDPASVNEVRGGDASIFQWVDGMGRTSKCILADLDSSFKSRFLEMAACGMAVKCAAGQGHWQKRSLRAPWADVEADMVPWSRRRFWKRCRTPFEVGPRRDRLLNDDDEARARASGGESGRCQRTGTCITMEARRRKEIHDQRLRLPQPTECT